MIYALIENGTVTDTLRVDPYSIYPASYASQFAEAANGVERGWTWDGEVFAAPVDPNPAATLAAVRAARNQNINLWRAQANQTSFSHAGKLIACDTLSRSDIDAVAGSIALTGAFPVGFPGAWRAMDNSYLLLPDVAAFKSMYSSMTLQGTINFGHSQALKATLAAASTLEQINAVVW